MLFHPVLKVLSISIKVCSAHSVLQIYITIKINLRVLLDTFYLYKNVNPIEHKNFFVYLKDIPPTKVIISQMAFQERDYDLTTNPKGDKI